MFDFEISILIPNHFFFFFVPLQNLLCYQPVDRQLHILSLRHKYSDHLCCLLDQRLEVHHLLCLHYLRHISVQDYLSISP